jgi:hypothetical protein
MTNLEGVEARLHLFLTLGLNGVDHPHLRYFSLTTETVRADRDKFFSSANNRTRIPCTLARRAITTLTELRRLQWLSKTIYYPLRLYPPTKHLLVVLSALYLLLIYNPA